MDELEGIKWMLVRILKQYQGEKSGPRWGRVENDSQITGEEGIRLCLTRCKECGRQGIWMTSRFLAGVFVYVDSGAIS